MSQHEESHAAQGENNTEECRGTKRHAEEEQKDEKVHSANEWEKVDLGDEGRKNKFLRLMGASKKDHHGRIIIGEQKPTVHVRSCEETLKVNSELEDQYRQGLEFKITGGARRHIGLGFADNPGSDGKLTSTEISRTASEVSMENPGSADQQETDSFLPAPEIRPENAAGCTTNAEEDDGKPSLESNNCGSEESGTKKLVLGGFVRGAE